MREVSMKLRRSDLAVSAVGIELRYDRTSPQAPVDLEIARDEAVQTVRDFAVEQGAGIGPDRQAVVFGGDSVALAFLQRQVDAFLLSTPLLTSANTRYVASGAIAGGLALVPGVLGYRSSRGESQDGAAPAVPDEAAA